MSALALQLIEEAKRTRAKKLDLGNCGLTELPEELFELVWLEELYLSSESWIFDLRIKNIIRFRSQNNRRGNRISHFQHDINNLQQLKILVANGSNKKKWRLHDLSPLNKLQNLQTLSLQNTDLLFLDPLKNLQNLRSLDIENTQVSDLAPLINSQKLIYLRAHSTQVQELNPLKHLLNLENLYLSNTLVYDLTPLKQLNKLQEIFVGNTEVDNLEPLRNLYNLKYLSVQTTLINNLEPLKELQKLEYVYASHTATSNLQPLQNLINKGISVKWSAFSHGINIQDCPLSNPPIEIAKQGNEAILNYWKQIEKQGGTRTINEAKLIIVGEGDTGKTTLFNKLIEPTFDLNQSPIEETQGINIHEGLEIKEGFRANLWDFGGQELQYMTHQFFLTPNAVYVLMMAARAEAPNLAYWFKIISLLGKDKSGDKVSLIIVLNKKQGSTGMPQYQDLLNLYADDFDYQFIEVDLALNDSRWQSLREAIVQRLTNLPIVKNELPKQWNPIRESLRENARIKPYISAALLQNICAPFEVVEEKDQFLMTNYLHQLGSLLHFQSEEDNLIDLIVLSPEWVVEGVYTVLKNQRIRKELNGKFTAKDMSDILCASHYTIGNQEKIYTKTDAQKLLQLMSKNNFDICYESKSNNYVAAQLLPSDRPANFRWNTAYNAPLRFRYQYPIMPKGLMSRLIVRLSDYIEVLEDQEMVWKKGALLKMDFGSSTCRVLMREEDGESKTGLRQIVIEVLEDEPPYRHRKFALQRVRDEIESLHRRWFKNITSEQIIPCNCVECKDSERPHTYELTELLKLKKPRAYCNVQEEFVPMQQLLEGVYETYEIKFFEREQQGMGREA